jgi:hypothetical protein
MLIKEVKSMYWHITKIALVQPQPDVDGVQIAISLADAEGPGRDTWYSTQSADGAWDFEALSAELVAAGFCPGDFGDCE